MAELAYYRITASDEGRVRSWKQALSNNHPIVFGIPVDDGFNQYDGVDYIDAPKMSTIRGGHALCALGYDETGVMGPNTWGPSWGEIGWFRISWEYIKNWAVDQWAIKSPEYWSK
jgi:C1A family cysteine protease